MEVSLYLHKFADQNIPRKQQAIVKAFAKALEVIPRQLCDNAGFDATNILTQLRVEHRKGNIWAGVDFDNEGVRDNLKAFVWEPSLVKVNAVQAAVEASCLILSVDETISMRSDLLAHLRANQESRKRAVRSSARSATWLTTGCGTTSAERERARDAKKMIEIQVVHVDVAPAKPDRYLNTRPEHNISTRTCTYDCSTILHFNHRTDLQRAFLEA